MRLQLLLLLFVISLVSLSFGCDQVTDPIKKLTATKIKDILDHPRDYENKEITIYGKVTDAVSLLVIKYFVMEDDTGTIMARMFYMLPRLTGRPCRSINSRPGRVV